MTHLRRSAEKVVRFYNGRGTAEQWIKEGMDAIRWTRLSCRRFQGNAVRQRFFALAYNLANFLRTLALPKEVEHWSLTTPREKLIKIGANEIRHGRSRTLQSAEVAVPRTLFEKILGLRASGSGPIRPEGADNTARGFMRGERAQRLTTMRSRNEIPGLEGRPNYPGTLPWPAVDLAVRQKAEFRLDSKGFNRKNQYG